MGNDKSEYWSDENVDEEPFRGTISLEDIYEICHIAITEPQSYSEAAANEHWKQAMEAEMMMILKNNTWSLVDKPKNRKVIGVTWIFRTKLNFDASINKFKDRLVVKGFSQVYRVDFLETFAPVARHDTIRLLIALAAKEKWLIWHLDIKSAFLNGTISENIYVNQREGFVEPGKEDKVCKLTKALYGLKQALRAWYERMDNYLQSQGFVRIVSEHTLYVKSTDDVIQLIVYLYVDDLLITGPSGDFLDDFKNKMKKEVDMSDLGNMSYFLRL